ncbi:MAG: hypothetical protein M3Q26_00715 [Acidobacteriota bacterium]|nr:hypothetical protein [Acidobacteriota bacterium]
MSRYVNFVAFVVVAFVSVGITAANSQNGAENERGWSIAAFKIRRLKRNDVEWKLFDKRLKLTKRRFN